MTTLREELASVIANMRRVSGGKTDPYHALMDAADHLDAVLAAYPRADDGAALSEVLTDLNGVCVFDMCPGPDAPFENMLTCRVCSSVQSLRSLLAERDSIRKQVREQTLNEALAAIAGEYMQDKTSDPTDEAYDTGVGDAELVVRRLKANGGV